MAWLLSTERFLQKFLLYIQLDEHRLQAAVVFVY